MDSERAPSGVSIGALQTVEALSRVIKREATGIEFLTADSFRNPLVTFQVGESFIKKVRTVLDRRRPSQDKLETLTGRVTGGVGCCTVQVAADCREGVRSRYCGGDFSPMFTPTLLESLNRTVRLHGTVERKGKQPRIINIHTVEIPEED